MPSGRLARSGLPRGQPRLAARMREMGDDRLGHAILRRLARRRSALTRRDAATHRRRRADGRTPASRNTRPGELPLLLGQEPLLVHLLGADRIRQGGRIRRPRHRPAAPGVRGILAG